MWLYQCTTWIDFWGVICHCCVLFCDLWCLLQNDLIWHLCQSIFRSNFWIGPHFFLAHCWSVTLWQVLSLITALDRNCYLLLRKSYCFSFPWWLFKAFPWIILFHWFWHCFSVFTSASLLLIAKSLNRLAFCREEASISSSLITFCPIASAGFDFWLFFDRCYFLYVTPNSLLSENKLHNPDT